MAGRCLRALLAVLLLAASALPPTARAQALAGTAAETTARELLNSERIERTFGSYGIEVLESSARLRVSSLYSGQGESRVCRTFAVVRYPEPVDPRIAAEHALILGGASIGSTFTGRGWAVVKTHSYFGEINASARLKKLMGGIDELRLAVDVYALDVVKSGVRLRYATIAEVHHPDYLRLADLVRIYGKGEKLPTRPDEATQRLLDLVADRSR